MKSIAFGVKSSVLKPYFCTPMDYVLLFATVIKCIAPRTFNHIMYNISVFLLIPAEIKRTLAAPLYILFLAGTRIVIYIK